MKRIIQVEDIPRTYDLWNSESDVEYIQESYDQDKDYDLYFVQVINGEIKIIYGHSGAVPYLSDYCYRIYPE